MKINLELPTLTDLRPRLTVIGVGGAGSNAVNNMISAGLNGVTFVVANTDAQSLASSNAECRIQLGVVLTEGLGAGAKPEIGEAAAEEAAEEIRSQVAGSHMVFIAAGMGGGTGTGAASVIARIAREEGALTVGVVTKPFQFEGSRRMRSAEAGIAALRPNVDTLIVIPNQNLFRVANEKTTFSEAFVMADQILYAGIACIVDLIVKDGLINLDFADVRTVMADMGTAMMGTGEAGGDRRAVLAAEEAISNPLLDDISLKGARGLLVSITGGRDLTLYEVDEAANRVRQEVDGEATIIVGATFDDTIGDRLRVSIVASGMERNSLIAASKAVAAATQRAWPELPIESGSPPPVGQHQPPLLPAHEVDVAPQLQPDSAGAPRGGLPVAADMGRAGGEGSKGSFAAAGNCAAEPTHSGHAGVSGWAPNMPGENEPAGHVQQSSYSGGEENSGERLASLQRAHVEHGAAAGSHPPAMPSAGARQWTSEEGVVFQDAPPQFSVPPAYGTEPQPSLAPRFEPLAQGGAPFSPAPPVEPKRGARRLPEVEDFPPVGQREYRAKMEQYEEGGRSPPRAYAPAPEPARKLGFFERLTGARKRQKKEAAQQQKAGRAIEQERRDSGHRDAARTRSDTQMDKPSTRDDASQESELPVFFGNGPRR